VRGYTHEVLVLTREVGQSIVIGNNVRITVVQVRGDQARIGIEAPREIPVHRLEVFEELQGANTSAARTGTADLDVLRGMDPPTQ
jgi:carbon storage regulator